MLTSRGLGLMRIVAQHVSKRNAVQNLQQVRNGHVWSYRMAAPPVTKQTMILTELCGGFLWWWILWHFYHEYEHVTGEFDYPDTSKWTDAELGIPPDDEDC